MKLFWVRFGILSILWLCIITLNSDNVPISILFFAASLALYFFLSVGKFPNTLIVVLLVIGFIHFLIVGQESAFYTMALFYFYSLDGVYRISRQKSLIVLSASLFLSLFSLLLHDQLTVEAILVLTILYVLAGKVAVMITKREEIRQLYEELRGEYRNLKRLNLVAERDARLEERTNIARDIHDSVGHRLTALIMKLEMLSIQRQNEEYTELKRMATESLEETRQAVRALKIEENEGIATVVQLIRKLESESHIMVQFTMKQGVLSVGLSNEKSVVLYRVIQEALTNAMRHAQSREVRVTLGKSATGSISFEIENALHKATSFKEGFGITMMRKRVDEIGGRLEVVQTTNQFLVSGIIPCEG
ncbi:sensor histidine kinase [Oceanobacillus manasiensis]|uniref:sensor histidine kinase n=1 Tax=Oceanobacillus manasiensis TaxID=586413 RepID=UPI0005AA4F83|nr:sensor histidine kinase [Oceanobacillus manasiensis]